MKDPKGSDRKASGWWSVVRGFNCTFALLLLPFMPVEALRARTWNVEPDGTGNAPTIQAAIDSAATGDTVLVASGTYDENLSLAKSLTLRSLSGPETTIIDAGRRGRVLTIENCAGQTGPTVVGLTLRNGLSVDDGGGVLAGCTGTTLHENIIERNVAGSAEVGGGGGIACVAFSCLIESNVIRNNLGGSVGGGLLAGGNAVVRGNVITGNACHVEGGGAFIGSGVFTENLIAGNISDHFAGGVVINVGGTFANNTVVNNRIGDPDLVAGVLVYTSGIVRNNIVARNSGGRGPIAGHAFAIGCKNERSIEIDCNDVWGNDIDEIRCIGVGPDNISANPLFCDEMGEDFYLGNSSPCAPSQSAACGLIGAFSPRCELISVHSVSWGAVKGLYR